MILPVQGPQLVVQRRLLHAVGIVEADMVLQVAADLRQLVNHSYAVCPAASARAKTG